MMIPLAPREAIANGNSSDDSNHNSNTNAALFLNYLRRIIVVIRDHSQISELIVQFFHSRLAIEPILGLSAITTPRPRPNSAVSAGA